MVQGQFGNLQMNKSGVRTARKISEKTITIIERKNDRPSGKGKDLWAAPAVFIAEIIGRRRQQWRNVDEVLMENLLKLTGNWIAVLLYHRLQREANASTNMITGLTKVLRK